MQLRRLLARLLAPPRCGRRGFLFKGKCIELDPRRATLFTAGYILSPLSFWNDAFVNIPLAYAAALIASMLVGGGVFPAAFFAAYLASNVAGLLMMHVAVRGVKLEAKSLAETLVAATVYTVVATLLTGEQLPSLR